MSLTVLLASKRLKRHAPVPAEIAALRKIVARDLADAAVRGLSADRTFATAYNAGLQLCKMALVCTGYRVSSSFPGHHQTTIEAAGLVLGRSAKELTDYFETCRRMRNFIDYDYAEVATEAQSRELLAKVAEFQELIEAWIAKRHPGLKP